MLNTGEPMSLPTRRVWAARWCRSTPRSQTATRMHGSTPRNTRCTRRSANGLSQPGSSCSAARRTRAAWRAATAIAGVLGIVLLIRITLRLFRNLPVALLAGLLMAIDGVSIVMSRTGLLDIFIMVFALGAFSLLLIHRDGGGQTTHGWRSPVRTDLRRSRSPGGEQVRLYCSAARRE